LHPLTGGESIPQAFEDGKQAWVEMMSWKILKNVLRRRIRRRTVIQIP